MQFRQHQSSPLASWLLSFSQNGHSFIASSTKIIINRCRTSSMTFITLTAYKQRIGTYWLAEPLNFVLCSCCRRQIISISVISVHNKRPSVNNRLIRHTDRSHSHCYQSADTDVSYHHNQDGRHLNVSKFCAKASSRRQKTTLHCFHP